MGRKPLLSGYPGVRKATLARKLLNRLPGRAGGYYAEEIREGRICLGFRIVPLVSSKPLVATIMLRMLRRHTSADAIKAYPLATLIEVTRDDRDQLIPSILELLGLRIDAGTL